ncbi:LYR motif-containing protein [archaeon]|nr:MAG: LYR motif-containing protein [archaeon]
MVLSPTLSMYKSLLKFARRLPKDKRADSIDRIRNEFRQHSNVHDAKRIEELLKHAQSTLGYLKIVTPRRSYEQQGVTKVVFGDLSAPKKAVSNWTGKQHQHV